MRLDWVFGAGECGEDFFVEGVPAVAEFGSLTFVLELVCCWLIAFAEHCFGVVHMYELPFAHGETLRAMLGERRVLLLPKPKGRVLLLACSRRSRRLSADNHFVCKFVTQQLQYIER